MNKEVLEQLNSIREEIEKEQVSYGEIAYLQDHKQEVLETGDVLLCQWAGISEDEYNNGELFDDKYHVGRVVTLINMTREDDELEDFLEEHGHDVVIDRIEDSYFWGKSAKDNTNIPYHMEYGYIGNFTDKVVQELS